MDGVVITAMSATGASPSYYNYDNFEEIQVATSGQDIRQPTGGVGLNLIIKRGTNQFHGQARGYFDNEIKRVHLEAALALWRYCEDSVRYIFGDGLGSPEAETVLHHLRAVPEGLSRTDIMTSIFKNNRRAVEIDAALQLLLEGSLARCEMKNEPMAGWKNVGSR